MFAFVLTVLFVVIAISAIGTLAASYARAFAHFGGLRHAAANCDEVVTVKVRIVEHRMPQLRIVSSNAFKPVPQNALPVAA